MINFRKVVKNIVDSVNWTELILLTLNSGIGLAITKYLGYEINWVISAYFILWTLFFYLGSRFIWFNPNMNFHVEDLVFLRLMTSVFQLLALLFFAISVVPLIQILIITFNNLLLIYLISIFCCWLLLRIYLEQKIQIFGLSESISAFMICLVSPLVILNLNGIQNHEILLSISFFSFLQVIAFKLFQDYFELNKGNRKAEFSSVYIGPYSILKIISGLIILGYVACISQLFLQDRMQLFYSLGFALPIALYFIFKINQISGDIKKEANTLMPIAIVFIIFVEVGWILGLWGGLTRN